MKRRDHFRRFQQKRYSSKVYRNPYFSNNKNKLPLKLLIIIGAVISTTIILFICLFSLPLFCITTVSVTGIHAESKELLQNQIDDYLLSRKMLFFHPTNRFLFSKNELIKKLSSNFIFETLTIRVKGKTINIDINERVSQLRWQSNNKDYLTDLQGIIIQELYVSGNQPNNSQLPLFVDKNNVAVSIGSAVMSKDEIEKTFQFHDELKKLNIVFIETDIDRLAGKWIGVKTDKGYLILFDPLGDINQQALILKTVIAQTIKDLSKLKYIDLRFGDHVYYK